METYSFYLMIASLCGLAALGIALAAKSLSDFVLDKWRHSRPCLKWGFTAAALLAALYGGTKSAGVSYPRTESGTAYLTDNGSSVTNDAVVLNFTRSSLVPDDAWLFLDACPLSVTNAADVAANCVTVYSNQFSDIELPLTVAYENATNFNWIAYTDWTPGPVVHTNGVVNVAWLKAKGEMPPSAIRVVPLRTDVAAINAETDEERAYRLYAPDTAFEVTVTNGATFAFSKITRLSGHASVTVDWGDGTASTHTSSPASHAYAADGKFVVKISDDISSFSFNDNSKTFLTAALRWGDSVTDASGTYYGCSGLTGFVPRWGANITTVGGGFYSGCYNGCTGLTGTIPPWTDKITNAGYTYYNCVSLTGTIPPWTDKITNASGTYYKCVSLTGTIPPWTDKITDASETYSWCVSLTGTIPEWGANIVNASSTYDRGQKLTGSIPPWNDKITNASGTYRTCQGLTGEIPPWGENIVNASGTYQTCQGLTGAWTDDPAELMPERITSHENCVIWSSAALRALFYSDWGGSREKPADE